MNMVKHTVIMEVSTLTETKMNPNTIRFRQSGHTEPDELTLDSVLDLDRTIWKDLGEPTTITVVVTPDDQLNQ